MSSKKRAEVQRQTFWTPLRVVSTFIALALLAAFGVSSCTSNDEKTPVTPNKPGSSVAGNALPANVRDSELRAADGAPIRISDYSGKVLLVNLWATWCGPCRIEIPELVKIHKEFQGRGVEMVGLSTENPDASAQTVRDFVRTFNIDYRVGWATPEVAVTLMQGTDSIPQSFIINRDGRIVKRFIGFSPASTPPQLRQALEDALKS